ncbi:hypothetical protein MTF65_10045 [Streptomyces sp. APSN-46.1]|uniref:hypothetical protein n=1 Tax=Streptomyces sp. APSN-46.1 TaxID=2929049 RepID=UPI001FB532E6|nr:hypothetical protein [Streptomyces sp. APSN-46.1]MCJ1677673.1 hypothetical protein [Streptomyces sp. APSN-46.1]
MSRITIRAIGLATALIGVLIGVYGTQTFATAVGLAGTGGALTVTGCRVDVSYSDRDREDDDRHETRRCWGEFSAANGSDFDPQHELVSDEAQPGDRVEVRDNGTIYMEPNAASATGGAAIIFIGLGMLVLGGLILITGRRPSAGAMEQSQRFNAAVRALPFGRTAFWTFLGSFAAGLLSFGLAELL